MTLNSLQLSWAIQQAYSLPDDLYQTAKISKLLLLMEKGEAADFRGRSLNEIDNHSVNNL
ncbi:hypothetical protein J437_LFUL012927 [Ladona fulva]|uniref:Uncharacterized protein n=1 Tax=Ladona fulva TaxID=123851 RepID=A0A8K0KCB4_LADFU|nr:hypothetical protein J437_LFUL012927 [Ladona fulva]